MGTPHPSAKSSSTTKRQTGSDPLTDANSELWFGDITVGSTKFTVDFDTGSSDLFLPGPNCDSSCDGHTTYTTDGAKDAGATFRLGFGDGSSVSGEVFTDSVTVAGLTANPQALGAADQYSTGFQSDQFP
jgi:cathepsin D